MLSLLLGYSVLATCACWGILPLIMVTKYAVDPYKTMCGVGLGECNAKLDFVENLLVLDLGERLCKQGKGSR